MKKIFLLLISTLLSALSYSQGRDFTFCYGNFSVTIFDGGRAEMVRYNQSGTVINTLSGEFKLYGIGNPTELLKVTYSGSSVEYRYDLIRDGRGTPSMIIDGQGNKYTLCKTSISNGNVQTQSLDELIKMQKEQEEQKKLAVKETAKALSAEMKIINSNINNPQLRKNVPEQFKKVTDNYYLNSAMELFSESDKALFKKLDNISKTIIQENLNKTGDKYGKETNSSLISYLNTKDIKMELPIDCKMYQYKTNDYYLVRQSKNGYVKNGELYTAEGLLVGKINQDGSKYYIDFKDSNNKNLRIIIFKKGDISLSFNSGREEVFFISMCESSIHEFDCGREGESIIIEKNAPKGASLVAALQLSWNYLPKQTSASNSTQSKSQQAQQLEETFRDIDGNEYHTIKVGTQIWMVENLRTTRYRNGDPIPKIDSNDIWKELKNDGYCNYNNDESISSPYGRIYNWYAASDNRNIAPLGWHIPTKEEFETLKTYLNVENDNLGFKIIHNGVRYSQGDYSTNCEETYLWVSTIEDVNSQPFWWYFYHYGDKYGLSRTGASAIKNQGCAIRCIKDNSDSSESIILKSNESFSANKLDTIEPKKQNPQSSIQPKTLPAGYHHCEGTYTLKCYNPEKIGEVQRCLDLTSARFPNGSGYYDSMLQDGLTALGYENGFTDADIPIICQKVKDGALKPKDPWEK